MVRFECVQPHHIDELIARLRAEDLAEIKATTALSVDFVVKRSINSSDECACMTYQGEVAVVFGYGGQQLSDDLCIWLLGTPISELCGKSIVKYGRMIIKDWMDNNRNRTFSNLVSTENIGSMRLLKALGAKVYPPRKRGLSGEFFSAFQIGEF